MILAVVLAIVAWTVLVSLVVGVGRRPRRDHTRFVRHLGQKLALDVSTDPARLEGTELTGALEDGREASVKFDGPSGKMHATFSVEVRAAPRMRVRLGGGLFGKAANFKTGDERFDRWFSIETADPKKTRRALDRAKEVRHAIVEAFGRWHAEKLEIRSKRLFVTVPLSELHRTKDFQALLGLLANTARAFDRVGIRVKVLGGDRLALAGAHGRARCAYCHEDLTGDEPDLVACEACGTVLHEGCWSELGQCPLLGCTGKAPERARVT